MENQYLEVRSELKIGKIFLLALIFLISCLIIVITIISLIQGMHSREYLEPTFIVIRLIALISIVLLAAKLSKKTTVILKNEDIIVLYPFRFKGKKYSLDSIKKYSVKITKGDSGNGPGYIDFPYQTLQIYFNDYSTLTVSSKDNTNIQELINRLKEFPELVGEF